MNDAEIPPLSIDEIPGTFADGYSAALVKMVGVAAAELGPDHPIVDRMIMAAGRDMLRRARAVLETGDGNR